MRGGIPALFLQNRFSIELQRGRIFFRKDLASGAEKSGGGCKCDSHSGHNPTAGEEALKKLIAVDEGASHLGEVALVPHSSPRLCIQPCKVKTAWRL